MYATSVLPVRTRSGQQMYRSSKDRTEDCTCLSTLADIVLHVAVDSGDDNFRTEHSVGISNGDFAVYVVALTSEQRMVLHVDVYHEVACVSAVYAAVALTAKTDSLTVIDTCGDVERHVFLHTESADTTAF